MVDAITLVEKLKEYLPLLIPIAAIQLGLTIAALVHAIRHPKYKAGNMIIWVLVIILINTIGPILYFIIGRGDSEGEDTE